MNYSYSQIGQDLNVLQFYNHKKNGYFIEVGANNGIYLSNTYLLEKKYNWKGICIEPHPIEYEKLIKNRDVICEKEALYSSSGISFDFKLCNESAYSGISHTIDKHAELVNSNYKLFTVNTITLTELLNRNNSPIFIEYLSLDTEGSEYEILKGIDFEKYTFGLIHIEHNHVEPRRSNMKELLLSHNYIYVKENQFDDIYIHNSLINRFSELFIDKTINNIKGNTIPKRFIDIMSDPTNYLIKRVDNAGNVENGCVIMWNGIKILENCYYGNFSDILKLNKGCHEPAEEYLFNKVLEFIPDGATMIELGSYWAFYTNWFSKYVKNAKNYCIEPDKNGLEVGKKNCDINNVTAHFTQAFVGKDQLNVTRFTKEHNIDYIDLLHSDIQGYEYEMLNDIIPLLKGKKVNYLFISTHSDELHYNCLKLLKQCDYRIISSADHDSETFCYDGIIVACPSENNQIPEISIGSRKHTKLAIH